MSILKRFVKAITGSKKAMVALGTFVFGMVAPAARRAGVDITPSDVDIAIKIGIGYVVGQGIADNGKSAKQLELAADKAKASVRTGKEAVELVKDIATGTPGDAA